MNVSNYREVLRSRSFAYFWSGFALSSVGDSMTRVALTWYVWDATRSAPALGLLSFLYMAPIVAGGVVAGWLLDRFGRRNVILTDNVVRGGVVAVIPILAAFGILQVWHAYAVAATYGSLMMISLAGGPALIPSLVPREHLSTANAMETIGFTLSGALGPTIAGLLILIIGAANVLIIDAASYLLFAALLTRIPPDRPSASLSSRESQRYGIGEAIQLMLTNRILLSTTLIYMMFNLGLGMMFVWLPVYVDEVLGGGARLFGILLGLMALGSVVSSLAAGGVTLPWTLGTLICSILILSGASLGVVAAFGRVWTTAVGLALFGFFNAPLTIWAQTLRMRIIPEHLRGRAFALMRMLMQSANPLGGLVAGPLVPALGLVVMVGLSAVLVAAPGALGLRVKALRRAGAPEEI